MIKENRPYRYGNLSFTAVLFSPPPRPPLYLRPRPPLHHPSNPLLYLLPRAPHYPFPRALHSTALPTSANITALLPPLTQAIWNMRDNIKYVQNLLSSILDSIESVKNVWLWVIPSKVPSAFHHVRFPLASLSILCTTHSRQCRCIYACGYSSFLPSSFPGGSSS